MKYFLNSTKEKQQECYNFLKGETCINNFMAHRALTLKGESPRRFMPSEVRHLADTSGGGYAVSCFFIAIGYSMKWQGGIGRQKPKYFIKNDNHIKEITFKLEL